MSGENLAKFYVGALDRVRDRALGVCLVLDRPDPLSTMRWRGATMLRACCFLFFLDLIVPEPKRL